MAGSIRCISFDLDGTLWDIAPVIERAEDQLYSWLKARCPERLPSREQVLDQRVQVWQKNEHLRHRLSDLRIVALREALLATGHPNKKAERLALGAFEIFIANRHSVDYFEHSINLLHRLSRDYIVGVITNGNADVVRLGIGHYFDFICMADRLDYAKPDKRIFNMALSHAGVRAEEAVHIGDSLNDDVHGALDAGMHAIWFNAQGEEVEQDAQQHRVVKHEIKSLKELPQCLKALEASQIVY